MKIILTYICLATLIFACKAQETEPQDQPKAEATQAPLLVGADVLANNVDQLKGKNIGLLVNQTSRVNDMHLLDFLIENQINVAKLFAPEHGFRGKADAGEKILDGVDSKTGVPVISLYGKHKKPSQEDLAGIDVLIFDIQDVGARFYTYISTLHYAMEACAENNLKLMVLDRPNPNGSRVDGNILDMNYSSFVGMHPIPVLHGMTVGEYAQMINGENWLKNKVSCDLVVVKCQNYTHSTPYNLPVKPSPNLPNDRAIFLYPSICFFEGTVISEGRGTDFPFQVFGAPEIDKTMVPFSFSPVSKEGAKYPKFENKTCYGYNLSETSSYFQEQEGINLSYLINMYNLYPDKENFFLKNGFFDKLAGGSELRKAIIAGQTAEEIKASWAVDLQLFKEKRARYLLYPDFE